MIKDHPGVHMRADRIKNPAFMKEMREYLDRHNLVGLFEMNSFDFVDSKSDVCIQAADFIGGSVRACFERNPQTAMTDPVLEKLRPRIAQLVPFPESYGRYIAKIPGFGEHDHAIEARAVLDAEYFLQRHGNAEDAQKILEVAVVRKLLEAVTWRNDCWVSTESLMDHLGTLSQDPLSEQSFRSVIGRLRDAGLLIASRTSGGYKIPTCMADIIEFLNRQNSQLAPMMGRIRMARETVNRATDNAVDILAMPAFQNLKTAVDAMGFWYETNMTVLDPIEPERARPVEAAAFVEIAHSISPVA